MQCDCNEMMHIGLRDYTGCTRLHVNIPGDAVGVAAALRASPHPATSAPWGPTWGSCSSDAVCSHMGTSDADYPVRWTLLDVRHPGSIQQLRPRIVRVFPRPAQVIYPSPSLAPVTGADWAIIALRSRGLTLHSCQLDVRQQLQTNVAIKSRDCSSYPYLNSPFTF